MTKNHRRKSEHDQNAMAMSRCTSHPLASTAIGSPGRRKTGVNEGTTQGASKAAGSTGAAVETTTEITPAEAAVGTTERTATKSN